MLRNLFNRKTDNLSEEQQVKVEEPTTEPLTPEATPEQEGSWLKSPQRGVIQDPK